MAPIIKKVWTSDITELTDRLKQIKSSDRINAEYFVFKANDAVLQAINEDDRAKREIAGRAQGKPVYILRYDAATHYNLLHITAEAVVTVDDVRLLEEIRKYDLNEVIESTKGECIIDAPPGGHFITPSGKHTTRFLRLTDALYSYNALDRISFWLQSHVSASSAVIIDTWSLSSIVLSALQITNSKIPFDCFHEHIGNASLAVDTLNKLERRIESDAPVLVLVGISSSGRFFESLPEIFGRSNLKNSPQPLSIYGLRSTPNSIKVLTKLDLDIDWYEENDCAYCVDGIRGTTYQIDTKYYYPRKYEERPVRFTKSLVSNDDKPRMSTAEFVHAFGNLKGHLLVHKDDPNDGAVPRHHAFYIDVGTLTLNTRFIESLIDETQRIEQKNGVPDLVISPEHDAARRIQSVLSQRWPSTAFRMCNKLSEMNESDRGLFESAGHICMVDDVLISGSRVLGYLREFREQLKTDNLKRVSWFPLIVRPPQNTDEKRIVDSLSNHRWTNDLFCVQRIFLPDWSGARECPWCEELRIFDRFVGALWDEPQWFKERTALLRNRTQGISSSPLIVGPFSEPKTLGAGSPLGNEGLSELQLLFILANGLQNLRSDSNPKLGKDDLLFRYVLFWTAHESDEKSGLFERFSEPLIQSCFLRVVKSDEWAKSIWSENPGFLLEKIQGGECDELIGETLLFYLRNGKKIPEYAKTLHRLSAFVEDEAVSSLLDALK